VNNYAFYKLNKPNFKKHPEWAIIMFYEIIHLIERVFAIAPIPEHDKHSKSHKHRYKTMQKLRTFIPRTIFIKYITLKNVSQDARYNYGAVDIKKWIEIRENEYKQLKRFFQDLYRKLKKERES